jgi:hypothetical protein
MPRYDVWYVRGGKIEEPLVKELIKRLQPGDRIVSIYPTFCNLNRGIMMHEALVELRHPSWAAQGIGYDTDAPPLEDEPTGKQGSNCS